MASTDGPAEGWGGAGPRDNGMSAIALSANRGPIPVTRVLVLARILVLGPESQCKALTLQLQREGLKLLGPRQSGLPARGRPVKGHTTYSESP